MNSLHLQEYIKNKLLIENIKLHSDDISHRKEAIVIIDVNELFSIEKPLFYIVGDFRIIFVFSTNDLINLHRKIDNNSDDHFTLSIKDAIKYALKVLYP